MALVGCERSGRIKPPKNVTMWTHPKQNKALFLHNSTMTVVPLFAPKL